MDQARKVGLALTCMGVAGVASYIHHGFSNPFLIILFLTLLFGPGAYLVMRPRPTAYSLGLVLLAVGTVNSLWLFGTGYVQGTDGPHHVVRTERLISQEAGIFDLASSIGAQTPLLYILTAIGANTTALPVHTIQLVLSAIIGALAATAVFMIVQHLYDLKHALLATAFLACSMLFVLYGVEIRTSTFSIPLLLFTFNSALMASKMRRKAWLAIALLFLIAVFLTHIVASLHALAIGILALATVVMDQYLFGHSDQKMVRLPVLAIVLFFTVAIYVTGAFVGVVGTIAQATAAIAAIGDIGGLGSSPGGGDAAGGGGAGLVVFAAVWLGRALFVGAATLVTLWAASELYERRYPTADVFLVVGSGLYLGVSVLLLALGDAVPLNPERFYRYFEYFAAVMIARGVLLLRTVPVPQLQAIGTDYRQPIISVLIVVLAIGAVTAFPLWTIDTNLRQGEGGERPYTDYSYQDVTAATFAADYVDRSNVIYGAEWNSRLHQAYGDHDVQQYRYTPPDELAEDDIIHFNNRTNQRQSLKYSSHLMERSTKIYDNGAVSHRYASTETLSENITHRSSDEP